MEGSKKYEDAALRGITRHHVWKSRTSDLTVINLRDTTELLGTQEPPATSIAAEVRRTSAPAAAAAAASTAATTTPPPVRPTTGKQESLNALLAKLQQGRIPPEPHAPAKTSQVPPTPSPITTVHAAATPSSAPPRASPPVAAAPVPTPAAAPAPPAPAPVPRAPERPDPTFPDPKESSPAPARQFEFITGTNIPGQGVVKKVEKVNEGSSMALFHDPLWGGVLSLDSFSASPPVKRSPKPQVRASLSELYASTTNAFTASPPVANPTPMASPPVSEMASTSVPATLAPQPMQMMPGLVPAPTPTLTTSYPMYTMPLQYMAQPQFPAGVVYNSPAFFSYGGTPMMMAQPQQIPQGYAMPTAAMMRPGTNVKAMPFVPGGAM